MKKILSASICAIALSAAVPAFAADDAKPMHHKHHMKSSSMMGPHTKMKMKGDPTTEELNAKSLDAARGGSSTDSSAAPAAPAAPMAAPASGTDAGTAPMNAPAGH